MMYLHRLLSDFKGGTHAWGPGVPQPNQATDTLSLPEILSTSQILQTPTMLFKRRLTHLDGWMDNACRPGQGSEGAGTHITPGLSIPSQPASMDTEQLPGRQGGRRSSQ